jgi:hypothetical protein
VGGRDRVGVACSGGATRAVRPAAEVNSGGGAPVVGGGEEEVGMLRAVWGSSVWGQLGSRGVGEGCSTVSRKRRQVEIAGTRRQAGVVHKGTN